MREMKFEFLWNRICDYTLIMLWERLICSLANEKEDTEITIAKRILALIQILFKYTI